MISELIIDLISQKTLLAEINATRKQQTLELVASKRKSECDALMYYNTITALHEGKKIQSEIITKYASKYHSKYFVILSALVVSSLFMFSQAGDLFDSNPNPPLKSQYLIQNLNGDITETWASWNISPDKVLTFTIIGDSLISTEKINEIKDVILSEKSLQIDNSLIHKGLKGTSSTYYVGWQGAMEQVSKNPTKMVVPQKFEYISPSKGVADITIKLVSQRNGDGYSGYTQSFVDKNQILKSTITLYDIKNLSTSQIGTITRHEFGHAIGLAHTTAPEELMAPTITTDYPFISPCTLDAIEKLYDGNPKSEVVCQI
jgi:predicted Zn-dependent protease